MIDQNFCRKTKVLTRLATDTATSLFQSLNKKHKNLTGILKLLTIALCCGLKRYLDNIPFQTLTFNPSKTQLVITQTSPCQTAQHRFINRSHYKHLAGCQGTFITMTTRHGLYHDVTHDVRVTCYHFNDISDRTSSNNGYSCNDAHLNQYESYVDQGKYTVV